MKDGGGYGLGGVLGYRDDAADVLGLYRHGQFITPSDYRTILVRQA